MKAPIEFRMAVAAGWVHHQMDPAPDWEELLTEGAEEIERLRETIADRDATIEGLHSYCEKADVQIDGLRFALRNVATNLRDAGVISDAAAKNIRAAADLNTAASVVADHQG